MFAHCFVCHAPFPRAGVVEHFPLGRRVAYDPERGRLWAVCDACGGWTLAPIEERWEALDELEQVVTRRTRRARFAGKTDNIALFRVGSANIIRVGKTTLIEEAAWRYGQPPSLKRDGADPFAPRPLGLGETLLGAAYILRTSLSGAHRAHRKGAVRRWVRFGDTAWRGQRDCKACGFVLKRLSYFDCRVMILKDAGDEALTPSLVRPCPRCRDETEGGLHLEGVSAEHTLRRVLAHSQDRGVPHSHLRAAGSLIDYGGGPAGISSILARYGRYLGELPITSAVAVRVLANEAYEQRMLNLEAAAVERRWREEEELAAIIDGDLTHVPSMEQWRLMLRGR